MGLAGCVKVPMAGRIDKIHQLELTLTGLRNSSAPRRAYSDSNAMLFNVSGLLTGSVGDEFRFHFANETLESDGLLFHEVEARGKLMRTDRTVFADVKVEARFDVECSRCLVDTVMPLSLSFAEEFRPSNADLMASHRGWFEEYGTDENDEALIIDTANVLDISTALWQGLSAALPMNPLCDPACKGMCSSCSADLNIGSCKCQSV